MSKLKIDLTAKDGASPVVEKAAKNIVESAKKVVSSDQAIKNATKSASQVKMEALTLSQKYKFAIAKEAAAGNKLQTNIVNRKEKLAKLERQLRSAIKHGDENAKGLAKQVAAERKHVQSLEENTKAQKDNNESKLNAKTALMGLAAAAAGAAAGTFLLSKRTAEQGDDMIKSAQRLGLTVEQYQRLGFAMKISGTSIEDQRGAMVRFARTARDAASGVKIAKEAFGKLGVSVKDSGGNFKGTNELLLDVANNFKTMPQSVEKTALAMDMFGRSGTALTQFLNLGTTGIVELGDEAERLGGVMSTTAAQQGEGFVDALTRMATASGGVARAMGEEFQPIFTRSMDQAGKSIAMLRGVWEPYVHSFRQFVVFARENFVPVMAFAAKSVVGFFSAVGLAWESVKAGVNKGLSLMVDGLNKVNHGVNKVRAFFGKEPFADVFNPFESSAGDATKAAQKLLTASAATMTEIDKISDAALNYATTQTTVATPAADAATNALKQQIEALKVAAADTKALKKAEKELADRRAAHLDAFIEGRAKAREANLKLHEDINKQIEKATEASIKSSARIADSLGSAMGTALAAVADGTGEVKDVFKAMAQSVLRAIQEVVGALLIKAAVNAGSTAAALGPLAAVAAASTTFAMLSGLIANYNKGGLVPGTGNTDSVPAMLTPGELVLPKDMASDLLRIAGKTTNGRFAEGGRVGGGGAGVVVNFNDGAMVQRSPAELDRFVRDKLVPSLTRLRRQGAFA